MTIFLVNITAFSPRASRFMSVKVVLVLVVLVVVVLVVGTHSKS